MEYENTRDYYFKGRKIVSYDSQEKVLKLDAPEGELEKEVSKEGRIVRVQLPPPYITQLFQVNQIERLMQEGEPVLKLRTTHKF